MALAITVKYGEKVKVGDNLEVLVKKAKGGNRALLIFITNSDDLKIENESFRKLKDRPPEEDQS